MKVLHVINNMQTGGAEKLVTDTVPLYNSKGIQADVLLLNGAQTPFMEQLKASGVTVYSLGNGSIYNALLAFKIVPYLKKYNVVHVHLFPAQYWVALAKMMSFSKTKLVYTEHSTSSRRMRKKAFKLIDQIFYKPYSKIICIAQDVLESVKEHINTDEYKLQVIENGSDITNIKDARPLAKSVFFKEEDIKLIIQVSSFQYPKDQPTVIRALQHLPATVKLLLVGDGHQKQECIDLADSMGLTNRVLFLGIRMDVPQLLKMADIVVLSSAYEGFSLSSVEGMAAGRPVVASKVAAVEDIVGGAGVLFPYHDDRQLAAEITKLLENKEYYSAVANKCIARAAQYDINIMVDKHIDLYNNL
jgi:glycosyltransferase involved in cell wall biosynthesis